MPSGLPIDVTNPDDIRAKFPALEDLIRAKRREADKLDALADDLARIANLKRREPAKSGKAKKAKGVSRPPSTRALAVAIVNEAARAMSIDEVTEKIDPPTKRDTVGWSLWEAATKKGELQSPEKGMYAPVDWKPDSENLLSSANGADRVAATEDAQR